jgi:hypothetical protein
MLMVGMASVFAWILTREQVPQALANFIHSLGGGKILFLFIINIAFLFRCQRQLSSLQDKRLFETNFYDAKSEREMNNPPSSGCARATTCRGYNYRYCLYVNHS